MLKSFFGRHKTLILVIIVSLALGWFGNDFFSGQATASGTGKAIRETSGHYTYINPILLCSNNEPKESVEYSELGNKIRTYISNAEYQGNADRVSVYYRNLLGGKWTGANENEKYSPASLLKVPTMIAVLKASESTSGLLDKTVFYNGQFDDNRAETRKPQTPLLPNQSYTINELIKSMIEQSDNNATRLLDETLDENYFKEVYTDLGMTLPTNTSNVDFLSVKLYSYFFRILYNGSYLNRDDSEKSLGLLAHTNFKDGLRAGVPNNIVIADKFGERQVKTPIGSTLKNELHDCGIVYYPNNPYILCVMTEGDDPQQLPIIIKDISKMVYDNQDNKSDN